MGIILGESGHIRLPLGGLEAADVFGRAFHVAHQSQDPLLFGGKEAAERIEEGLGVLLGDPEIVIGVDQAEQAGVKPELDVLDFRKARNEIGQAVPFAHGRRMEGGVKNESPGALERRGIAAGLGMLFQDDGLEALPGEGRGAAQPAQAGPDDDGVIGVAGLVPALSARQDVPIQGRERNPGQNRLEEIPAQNVLVEHDVLPVYRWSFFQAATRLIKRP